MSGNGSGKRQSVKNMVKNIESTVSGKKRNVRGQVIAVTPYPITSRISVPPPSTEYSAAKPFGITSPREGEENVETPISAFAGSVGRPVTRVGNILGTTAKSLNFSNEGMNKIHASGTINPGIVEGGRRSKRKRQTKKQIKRRRQTRRR